MDPETVQPTRLGIKLSPPELVIEYFEGPKRRLHHVHLLAEELRLQSTKRLIAELRRDAEHAPFVANLQFQQLGELLRRLRSAADEAAGEAAGPAEAVSAGTRARPARGRSTPAVRRSRGTRAATEASNSSGPGVQNPAAAGGASTGKEEAEPAPWPVGAWTAWRCEEAEEACPDVGELFEDFRKSRGVEAIAASFERLLRASTAAASNARSRGMPLDIIRLAVGQQRRLARVLWERLDARRNAPDYDGQTLAGHHAVVVGAGPVGLRCALELRLLGAEVVILERRCGFDRINRLHLWPWCGEDLKGWGAKVLEPPELSFGSDPDFLHIGIAELQMLLFKACLLLGVQIFFGTEYLGSQVSEINGPVWEVLTSRSDAGPHRAVGPLAPERLRGASILVGADGPRGGVANDHGLELVQNGGLRKEAALGLVANYTNRQSVAEKRMRSFSLARQFYEQLFRDCEKDTGMALENIVCYIGSQTHYFVMTPTRKSLQEAGVLASEDADGSVLGSLDESALQALARKVCAFPWKPTQGPLPTETLDSPVGAPSLFDFSKTRRAGSGLKIVQATSALEAASSCANSADTGAAAPISAEAWSCSGSLGRGKVAKLLVGLCGDALIEPFWPEGLGIVRGFFAALDLASSAKLWVETGDNEAAANHFELSYRQLKSLSAKTRQAVLRPEEHSYRLNPSTRYKHVGPQGSQPRSVSMPAVRTGR